MKASHVIVVLSVIVVTVVILYSALSGKGDAEYKTRISESRKEKDEFMRTGEGSPFEKVEEPFTGLKYFDVNPKFRIVADLEPVENKQMVVLPTSDGKESRYIEYARAKFRLDGIPCSLLILEVVDNGPFRGTLFLAFADQSSTIETYGAGRYLDVKKTPGASTITLDFNEAYNPYCAYSEEFSCPLPPRENILNVLIAAGEKTYHDH